MAIVTVKPAILERNGFDIDDQDEIKAQSDYIAARGISFRESQDNYIDDDGNDILFHSITNGVVSLSSLISTSSNLFGTQFNYIIDNTETSTTNTSWDTKLTLNLVNLPSGNYYVSWYFEWKLSETRSDFWCDISLNYSQNLAEIHVEPKDKTSWNPASGFDILNLSGNNSFYMDYRPEKHGKQASIRRARFVFWRVY